MLERRSSAAEGSERLKERRRRGRYRTRILFGILLILLIGAFMWLTWQPYIRIQHISVSNSDSAIFSLVQEKLVGSYFGIVPHDSFFFVPEHAIRAAIIAANPGLQAVSIQRDGFTSLTISLNERVPVARWCGLEKTEGAAEYCYLFDAEGYIYRAADPSDGRAGVATGTPILNSFTVYDSLAGDAQEPLRSNLAHAKATPDAFDFARKVGSLGSPVTMITFHGDETDLVLASGTHVTYVVGSEEVAFADLMSAKSDINLTDGSLDYVDLRFPAKVYLKKKGDTVAK
jgi:cell division septal protein FtsQ